MPGSSSHADPPIDKRDFDAHRSLLQDGVNGYEGQGTPGKRRSRAGSRQSRASSRSGLLSGSDDGLLNDVVEGIVERDIRKMHTEVVRVISFVWGVVTW
ncbi:transporter mch1 [Penicillium chermesinum]|uniref:Transporter mch1 n=1 Tax=Penicillium chermesinum TaxID=63820 RepID=A0A9W9TX93_9EURO|nr:transporter mch1 [Penicillium chermesinum]KAJ5246637.1 transporter mch1 [Penicillium chermesinum]KAJ6144910.1 transporter mch1 [Penicillium chermesinum]